VGLRRLLTMAPAFVVSALGVNATDALLYSQVVLSFALPVPMIALVIVTSRRDVMGSFVNSPRVTGAAIAASVVILALNVVLLLQTFGVIG
jgi:manganese transport protein